MTTEREQILALAGAPVAEVVEYAIGGDGVFLRFTAEAEMRVADGDKLYTADQVLAARKALAEDVGQLKRVIAAFENGYSYDNLRQQLAEKDSEIERLKRAFEIEQQAADSSGTAAFANAYKLAAAQADNERLRDVLASYADPDGYITDGEQHGGYELASSALLVKSDDAALKAMIAKAGEVMRDRCAKAASDQWLLQGHAVSAYSAIRALPGVTLEDLQG